MAPKSRLSLLDRLRADRQATGDSATTPANQTQPAPSKPPVSDAPNPFVNPGGGSDALHPHPQESLKATGGSLTAHQTLAAANKTSYGGEAKAAAPIGLPSKIGSEPPLLTDEARNAILVAGASGLSADFLRQNANELYLSFGLSDAASLEKLVDQHYSKTIEAAGHNFGRGDIVKQLLYDKEDIFTGGERAQAVLNFRRLSRDIGQSGRINTDIANLWRRPKAGPAEQPKAPSETTTTVEPDQQVAAAEAEAAGEEVAATSPTSTDDYYYSSGTDEVGEGGADEGEGESGTEAKETGAGEAETSETSARTSSQTQATEVGETETSPASEAETTETSETGETRADGQVETAETQTSAADEAQVSETGEPEADTGGQAEVSETPTEAIPTEEVAPPAEPAEPAAPPTTTETDLPAPTPKPPILETPPAPTSPTEAETDSGAASLHPDEDLSLKVADADSGLSREQLHGSKRAERVGDALRQEVELEAKAAEGGELGQKLSDKYIPGSEAGRDLGIKGTAASLREKGILSGGEQGGGSEGGGGQFEQGGGEQGGGESVGAAGGGSEGGGAAAADRGAGAGGDVDKGESGGKEAAASTGEGGAEAAPSAGEGGSKGGLGGRLRSGLNAAKEKYNPVKAAKRRLDKLNPVKRVKDAAKQVATRARQMAKMLRRLFKILSSIVSALVSLISALISLLGMLLPFLPLILGVVAIGIAAWGVWTAIVAWWTAEEATQINNLARFDGVVTDADGNQTNYDANGNPISYDENGNPIAYDENGNPVSNNPDDCIALGKMPSPRQITDPTKDRYVNYSFKMTKAKAEAEVKLKNCEDKWKIECKKDTANCTGQSGELTAEVCEKLRQEMQNGFPVSFELKGLSGHPNGFELPQGQSGYDLINTIKVEVECVSEGKTATQSATANARTCVGEECAAGMCWPLTPSTVVNRPHHDGAYSKIDVAAGGSGGGYGAAGSVAVKAPKTGSYTFRWDEKTCEPGRYSFKTLGNKCGGGCYVEWTHEGKTFRVMHMEKSCCDQHGATTSPSRASKAISLTKGDHICMTDTTGANTGTHAHVECTTCASGDKVENYFFPGQSFSRGSPIGNNINPASGCGW